MSDLTPAIALIVETSDDEMMVLLADLVQSAPLTGWAKAELPKILARKPAVFSYKMRRRILMIAARFGYVDADYKELQATPTKLGNFSLVRTDDGSWQVHYKDAPVGYPVAKQEGGSVLVWAAAACHQIFAREREIQAEERRERSKNIEADDPF